MANEILYGFGQLKDQMGERVLTVGEEHVSAAIGLTLQEHNRRVSQMVELFADPTLDYQINYRALNSGRLQPMDENGRPLPIQSSKYTVAFPIRMGGAGTGENFVTAAKMTVRDLNDQVAQVLIQDLRWIRDHIFAALFTNVSYSYTDPDYGALTIYGLANSDTVQYAKDGGVALATDTHYLATASAIADATNPFPGIYDEVMEHPENSGQLITFIPTNLKATTMALTNFVDAVDPNVTIGSSNNRLTANLGVTYPGQLIGYTDKNWIVEWKSLPDNYTISIATDGPAALGMRQDAEKELQGLILRGRENAPFTERYWYRRLGFGVKNRVKAVVQRFGNGTYAVPTGYTQPIA